MQKLFKDVQVGTQFTFNNKQYLKINQVKVSCCRSVNCHVVGVPNDRTFLQPDQQVEVKN